MLDQQGSVAILEVSFAHSDDFSMTYHLLSSVHFHRPHSGYKTKISERLTVAATKEKEIKSDRQNKSAALVI